MSTATESGTEVLLRAIHPSQGDLPPEASRWLLGLRLSAEDRDEVNRLAAKARAGTLTVDERSQLDEIERVTSLLELLQSKARLSLKNSGQPL
jgi:hypothetical protein